MMIKTTGWKLNYQLQVPEDKMPTLSGIKVTDGEDRASTRSEIQVITVGVE